MSQDNKKNSEEEEKYFVDSFKYVETFCSNGNNQQGIEYLMACMCFCYTYFKIKTQLTENEFENCERKKNNAVNISMLGRLWQYIKDWFHNKFNKVQLELSQTEVIKRRQLSNLKDECNKFIMPRLEQAKKNLGISD